jgi:hypothetical protein
MKRRLQKKRLKRRQVSQQANAEVNQSVNSIPANPVLQESQPQEAVGQQLPETGSPIPTIRIRTISPREILAAGGATVWAEKMGHTAVSDEVAGCIPMSDEEFDDLLSQLRDSK